MRSNIDKNLTYIDKELTINYMLLNKIRNSDKRKRTSPPEGKTRE